VLTCSEYYCILFVEFDSAITDRRKADLKIMNTDIHEQILTEQFNAVLADLRLCVDLYKKTNKQGHLIAAVQKWGVLCGLAMAARQFGIVSLQDALDRLTPPEE
jgi:hypothetical protein